MPHRRYIVLMSLSKENAKVGQMALAGIKRDIDPSAGPLWIDSKGVGIFLSTSMSAREIWKAAFPQEQASSEREGMKDMLVLELGADCLGWQDTKAMAWLNSHPAAIPAR